MLSWVRALGETKMLLKKQMIGLRRVMIGKKIEALNAQIELAAHNVHHFGRRMEDQQAVVTQLGEEQDEEEEACEDLQVQLQQMKREQKEKEDWLKTFWRSNVLYETPGTRKNLQKRRYLCERRPMFGLDTEESRREQEQLQEALEQTLTLRKEREQELAERYHGEDLTLQCLQGIFFDYLSPQLVRLIESRNNEILRGERMDND